MAIKSSRRELRRIIREGERAIKQGRGQLFTIEQLAQLTGKRISGDSQSSWREVTAEELAANRSACYEYLL